MNDKPIDPNSIEIPEIFTEGQDHIFMLRCMALVWTIFYDDKVKPKIVDQLRIVSYSEFHGSKCALIESRDQPFRTYEVVYDAPTGQTHVTSYIEQDKYVFEAGQLED